MITEDRFLRSIKGYKKLGAFILTALTVIFGQDIGIEFEQAEKIVYIAMAYVLGQGYQDAQRERTKHLNDRTFVSHNNQAGESKF